MGEKIYLQLLVLCTILSQGIASLSDNMTTNSLDLLVRKKRIIDPMGNRSHPKIQDVPYVVPILAAGQLICSGIILNAHVILTAATCVAKRMKYSVLSGSEVLGHGTSHTVVGLLNHYRFSNRGFAHNIALLSIHEPIVLRAGSHMPIQLYLEEFHPAPGSVVTTSGWGIAMNSQGRTFYPDELRTTNLRTININLCRQRYHGFRSAVPDDVICTYDEGRRIGRGDGGSPLVFNGRLVGVQASDWIEGGDGVPDVFVNVALSENREWIVTHILAIPPYPAERGLRRQNSHRNHRCSQVHPC